MDNVPNSYLTQTQDLYDYNKTLYELQGIGILFIILRSIRIISNALLPSLLTFKILLLGKLTLNLYYFTGLALFTYMRFGTNGTQLPYDVSDSTNGLYYYLFGQNSNITVQSPYLLNGNYTQVLMHDCDFTLLWVIIMLCLCIPYKYNTNWHPIFRILTLAFFEGSIFELTLSSTGQIYQTIKNTSTDALNISYSCIAGLLLLGIIYVVLRPTLSMYKPKLIYIDQYTQYMIDEDQRKSLYQQQIELFNEFVIALTIPLLQDRQFIYIIYAELGIYSLQSLFMLILWCANDENRKYYLLKLFGIFINLGIFSIIVLCDNSDIESQYQYGFILIIIMSVLFLIDLAIHFYQMYLRYIKEQSNEIERSQQMNTTNQNIEMQQITIEQTNDHTQTTNQQKVLETSIISNINKPLLSQFQSQPSSIQFNSEDGTMEFFISKKESFSMSEIFDSGFIKIQGMEFFCHFRFQVIVLNNNHEVDPKILKRNVYGTRIKGIHTFTFVNHSVNSAVLSQIQLKIYFADKLVYREIKIQNQFLNAGQQVEFKQEYPYEQSESMQDKLSLKIVVGNVQQPLRFDICNNELKLFKVIGCNQKMIMKLKASGVDNYQILFEEKSEKFNLRYIQQFCVHYKMLQYNIDSSEAQYRNQQLSSKFAKLQLILPYAPYIKLLLIIELQVNKEYVHGNEALVDSSNDLSRPQYVMVSIFAKKSSTQLSQSHRSISLVYGNQLLNYFRQL